MTAAGWYPNPADERTINYWTGSDWTGERRWDGSAWLDITAQAAQAAQAAPTAPSAVASPATAGLPASRTFWLLAGGAGIMAVAQFLTYGSLTANGTTVGSLSLPAAGQFIVATMAGLVGLLAWRHRDGKLSIRARIGVAVLLGLLVATFAARVNGLDALAADATKQVQGPDYSAYGVAPISSTQVAAEWGLGLYAYTAGMVAATIGLVRSFLGKA